MPYWQERFQDFCGRDVRAICCDTPSTKERYETTNKINYKDMKKFIQKLERTRTLILIGDHDE